jgi:hypothetical protein
MLQEFSRRAEECLALCERAWSSHDRQLFLEMARAWYGLDKEEDEAPADTKH